MVCRYPWDVCPCLNKTDEEWVDRGARWTGEMGGGNWEREGNGNCSQVVEINFKKLPSSILFVKMETLHSLYITISLYMFMYYIDISFFTKVYLCLRIYLWNLNNMVTYTMAALVDIPTFKQEILLELSLKWRASGNQGGTINFHEGWGPWQFIQQ